MEERLIARNLMPVAQEIYATTPVTVTLGAWLVNETILMHQLLKNRSVKIMNLDSALRQGTEIAI